jgi:hypothetical protein
MNPTATVPPPFPWPGPEFDRNRERVPVSERNKWAGRHAAWSWDGTRILAGAGTLADLLIELREARIDPAKVVFDYFDAPDAGD